MTSNRDAEFDLQIGNRAESAPLVALGPAWLVEAKNWNQPAGTDEVHILHSKVQLLRGCTLGFLTSMAGFTAGAASIARRRELLVVMWDRTSVGDWIASASASDREAWLLDAVDRARRH